MLTNDEKKFLRRLANDLDSTFQIGKDGIGTETLRHLDNMLRTRELVKVTVLKHAPDSVRESCDRVADSLDAEIVQMIGRKFVLYRHSEELEEAGKALELPGR